MDEELIRLCALAARVACRRMTSPQLKNLQEHVEQACRVPAGFDWDRKAVWHADFVNVLADAAADPVLSLLLRTVPGQLHDLMVTVGPAASGIVASSHRRLLALFRAGDAEGAACEMEQHLGVLLWMRRVSCPSSPVDVAS
jgi:GntR family transcriptional regulator, transcriptional repressor for pyruvate dehydrogenase complex